MSNISSDPNNSAGVDTKRSRKPPPETWKLPSLYGEKVDTLGIAKQQIKKHFSNDNEGVKTKYQIMDYIFRKINSKTPYYKEITRYELRKLREYLTYGTAQKLPGLDYEQKDTVIDEKLDAEIELKKTEQFLKFSKTAAYILKIKFPNIKLPPFYNDEKPLNYVGDNPFSKENTDKEDLDTIERDDDIFINKKIKVKLNELIINYNRILYAYSSITKPEKFKELIKINKSNVEKTSKKIIYHTKKRAKKEIAYSKFVKKAIGREKLNGKTVKAPKKKPISRKVEEMYNNILQGKKKNKKKWEDIDTWELPLYPFNDKITSFTYYNDETESYKNISYGVTKDWIPIGANPDMVRNYTSTIARDYSGDHDRPSAGKDWEKWKNDKIKQTNERRKQGIKSPFKILIPKNTLVIVKRYSYKNESLRNLHSVGLDLATDTCEIIPYRFIYKHGIEIDGKVGDIKLGEVRTIPLQDVQNSENFEAKFRGGSGNYNKFIPEEYPLLPKDKSIRGVNGGKFYPRDQYINTFENLHSVKWIDSEMPTMYKDIKNMSPEEYQNYYKKYKQMKAIALAAGETNPGMLRDEARKLGADSTLEPNYLKDAIKNNKNIIKDGKRGSFIVPCKMIETDLVIAEPKKIKELNPLQSSHSKGYYLNGIVMEDDTELPEYPENMTHYPATIDLLQLIDSGNDNIRVKKVTIPRCESSRELKGLSLKVKVQSIKNNSQYYDALENAKIPSPARFTPSTPPGSPSIIPPLPTRPIPKSSEKEHADDHLNFEAVTPPGSPSITPTRPSTQNTGEIPNTPPPIPIYHDMHKTQEKYLILHHQYQKDEVHKTQHLLLNRVLNPQLHKEKQHKQ